jgi:hypothetical protein
MHDGRLDVDNPLYETAFWSRGRRIVVAAVSLLMGGTAEQEGLAGDQLGTTDQAWNSRQPIDT